MDELSNNTKKEQMQIMAQAIPYVEQIRTLSPQYNALNERYQAALAEEEEKRQLASMKKSITMFKLVFGVVMAVIVCYVLGTVLNPFLAEFGVSIPPYVFPIAVVVLLFVFYKANQSMKKLIGEPEATVSSDQIAAKMNQIQSQMEQCAIQCSNTGVFSFIPSRYMQDLNENPIAEIYQLFAEGRVDNIKEAINLYEVTLQNKKVLMYQQASLQELETSNALAAENNRLTKVGNAINAVGAAANILNLFK